MLLYIVQISQQCRYIDQRLQSKLTIPHVVGAHSNKEVDTRNQQLNTGGTVSYLLWEFIPTLFQGSPGEYHSTTSESAIFTPQAQKHGQANMPKVRVHTPTRLLYFYG
jgi:hypothetical protein